MDIFFTVYQWVLANAGTINNLAMQTGQLILAWYALYVSFAELFNKFFAAKKGAYKLPSPFKK